MTTYLRGENAARTIGVTYTTLKKYIKRELLTPDAIEIHPRGKTPLFTLDTLAGFSKPVRGKRVPVHGTFNEYGNYGCRCTKCRRFNRERMNRLRGAEPPAHGTESAYRNYGCRCDECKAAGKVANKLTTLNALAMRNTGHTWGCGCLLCTDIKTGYKPRGEKVHNYSGYTHGCRCPICAQAARDYHRNHRARKREAA